MVLIKRFISTKPRVNDDRHTSQLPFWPKAQHPCLLTHQVNLCGRSGGGGDKISDSAFFFYFAIIKSMIYNFYNSSSVSPSAINHLLLTFSKWKSSELTKSISEHCLSNLWNTILYPPTQLHIFCTRPDEKNHLWRSLAEFSNVLDTEG